MKTIESTYQCLLADVSRISGFSEIRGLEFDLQWCLKEAPQLEKQLLEQLEQPVGDTLSAISVDASLFPKRLRKIVGRVHKDPALLRLVRQLLLFCYKASVPHEATTTAAAYAAFERINSEVGAWDYSKEVPAPFSSLVRKHVQSVLYKCDWARDFLPSHGPGAATTNKWVWQNWFTSIDREFAYYPYYLLNEDHMRERDIPISDEISCKVVAVPKDSRGPRLVCVHPAEAIWQQQGARRVLERAIALPRSVRQGRPWPKGHVNFQDQTVNGKLALSSSSDCKYATLDLSEASDRLNEPFVKYLFGRYYDKFACSRAQTYELEGRKAPLHCYAPMGNATTFPVQSLVFWAICVTSLQLAGSDPEDCFIFGDDIIVPSHMAPRVIYDLEVCGLKVNRRKSFYQGYFRESCGVDAFMGVDVTPVRWKMVPSPSTLVDLVAACDLQMRLSMAGYTSAAHHLQEHVGRVMQSKYRRRVSYTNNPNHGGIAFYTDMTSQAFEDSFWSRNLQWFHTCTWKVKPHGTVPTGCGWNHVLDSLLSLERSAMGSDRPEHVSRRVRLSREWTPVL